MFSVQVTHPCPGSHFLHEVIADDNISEGVGECPSGIFAQWEKKSELCNYACDLVSGQVCKVHRHFGCRLLNTTVQYIPSRVQGKRRGKPRR